jgi:hypothetical protein
MKKWRLLKQFSNGFADYKAIVSFALYFNFIYSLFI